MGELPVGYTATICICICMYMYIALEEEGEGGHLFKVKRGLFKPLLSPSARRIGPLRAFEDGCDEQALMAALRRPFSVKEGDWQSYISEFI